MVTSVTIFYLAWCFVGLDCALRIYSLYFSQGSRRQAKRWTAELTCPATARYECSWIAGSDVRRPSTKARRSGTRNDPTRCRATDGEHVRQSAEKIRCLGKRDVTEQRKSDQPFALRWSQETYRRTGKGCRRAEAKRIRPTTPGTFANTFHTSTSIRTSTGGPHDAVLVSILWRLGES